MIEIPLTRGKVALVDDEDAERILAHKWTAFTDSRRKRELWYAVRCVRSKNSKSRKSVGMHREILNAPDHLQVDHKNGNGLDNRKSNLRLATRAQNLRSSHRPIGKSGYRGVYRHTNKKSRQYQAKIEFEGKRRSLVCYDCPKQAAMAYDAAAKELHGAFAALNFPSESGE